jgi:hypothetical protein
MWGTIGSRALREYCWANVWMLRRFSKREKYCHDGGMPRPPSRPRLARGPTTAIMGPPAVPAKPLFCRGNSARVHDSHPLGAGMEPSASFAEAEKYCLRGRGPRPPVKRSSSPTAGAQMGAIIEGMAPMAVALEVLDLQE